MNKSIKNHPFKNFESICKNFSKSQIDSSAQRYLFNLLTLAWNRAFSIAKNESDIFQEISRGDDGYSQQKWIFKELFYPEVSCSFILSKMNSSDAYVNMSKSIYATLDFRKKVLEDKLSADFGGVRNIDMNRYKYFFSRFTNSIIENRKPTHVITDSDPSDFIVLFLNDQIFKVTVISGNNICSEDQIYSSILACRDIAKSQNFGKKRSGAVGYLTCIQNRWTIEKWHELSRGNEGLVKTLNNALFSVSIDLAADGASNSTTLKSIHLGITGNRDYRRSLQIVANHQGRIGLIVNPHAGIGGSLSSRLSEEIYNHAKTTPTPNLSQPSEIEAFNLDPDPTTGFSKNLQMKINERFEDSRYSGFEKIIPVGKKEIEICGVKSDGFFHCAVGLAYFRCFNRQPSIGNFIDLRNVKHGDIWRYNSDTNEMKSFIQKPSGPTLRKAVKAHNELIKKSKEADDDFYLGAKTLMKLVNEKTIPYFSFPLLLLTCTMLVKNFISKFIDPDVWLSSIRTHEGIDIAGRASSKLSYIGKNNFAGHYMIFDDKIKLCLNRSLKSKAKDDALEKFFNELELSLLSCKKMIAES